MSRDQVHENFSSPDLVTEFCHQAAKLPIVLGLVLMAGRGQRFQNYNFPKPLIPVLGFPMFYHAAISLMNFAQDVQLVFCVTRIHEEEAKISKPIKEYFPKARIFQLPTFTTGPAQTAHQALENLHSSNLRDKPLFIMDCDFSFRSREYSKTRLPLVDLGLLTFKSNSPNYSYLEYDEKGLCTGCKEKQVVSKDAVAGLYYFRNYDTFSQLYSQEILLNGEIFMSRLINRGIKDKLRFASESVKSIKIFGTPADLEKLE